MSENKLSERSVRPPREQELKMKRPLSREKIIINKHNTAIFAQLVTPEGETLAGKYFSLLGSGTSPVETARLAGQEFGKTAKSKGADKIIFDRNRSPYHGRVKAFAEGLRQSGLKF